MDDIKGSWSEIKEMIKMEYDLTDISYTTWVEPLQFYNVVDDVVSIVVPADKSHLLGYISSKYGSSFQVTITERFDHFYDVKFISEKDIAAISP